MSTFSRSSKFAVYMRVFSGGIKGCKWYYVSPSLALNNLHPSIVPNRSKIPAAKLEILFLTLFLAAFEDFTHLRYSQCLVQPGCSSLIDSWSRNKEMCLQKTEPSVCKISTGWGNLLLRLWPQSPLCWQYFVVIPKEPPNVLPFFRNETVPSSLRCCLSLVLDPLENETAATSVKSAIVTRQKRQA